MQLRTKKFIFASLLLSSFAFGDSGKFESSGGGINSVSGSGSSTDNAAARFDGTTGKIIQNSSVIIDDYGNVNIGTNAAGSSAANVLALSNTATPPTTSVDLAQLYSIDISAGHATLGVYTEQAVSVDASLISTHSLTIFINGSKYKIPLIAQ